MLQLQIDYETVDALVGIVAATGIPAAASIIALYGKVQRIDVKQAEMKERLARIEDKLDKSLEENIRR